MGLLPPVRTSYTFYKGPSRTWVGCGPGAVPGALWLFCFLSGKVALTALWGDRGEDCNTAAPGQSTLPSSSVPCASLPAFSVSPRSHTHPHQEPLHISPLVHREQPHPQLATLPAKWRLGQTAATAPRVSGYSPLEVPASVSFL